MDKFAGEKVGQKPGDQVRGTEKATKRKDDKHPFAGRLVGASESKNMLADLERELKENNSKWDLAREFTEYKQTVAEGDVVQFPKKHKGDITDMHSCPKCGGDLQGGKYMGHEVQVCMPCKQVYLPPNSGIDKQGNKIKEQGVAEGLPRGGFSDEEHKSQGEEHNVRRVDMTGKECEKCHAGDYQETGVQDDMHGVLHCTNCGKQTDRWKMYRGKGVAEGSEQQWVVTVGTKTGGTSHTMTFSGTKEQAIKKAVARFGTSKNPVVTAKPKEQGVAEARKANTARARQEFGNRTRKPGLSPAEQDKKKSDSDAAWERLMAYADEQKKKEQGLNEFAPGNGGGESGRWYTDDDMTNIVGDGWWQDLDISGDVSKQEMINEAQAWLLDNGYRVQVLNVKVNDDDCEWFIEGSFQNNRFAKEGVAEGADERKQNALWAQITAHEKAAAKSKDSKRQHHINMANQLRSQLKTSDDVAEGIGADTAKLLGIPVVAGAMAIGAQHYDDQQPHVEVGGQNAKIVQYGSSRIPNNAMLLKGADGKMYRVWQQSGKGMNKMTLASPADQLKEFAPSDDDNGGGEEDLLFRFAKMWYSAPDVATQRRVEHALGRHGWEIGELESEEGGAYVMRVGDEEGNSYIGWSEEQLADIREGVAEESNPEDTVTLDIPLLIRLLEYSREDAQTDMDLHNVAERLIVLSAGGQTLSMSQYDQIIPGQEVDEEAPPAPGTPGVATAGGPAGATQQPNKPVDPAQQALEKQQQAKLQQNLAGLKTAGVQIDPAKAAQSLQKTDTGAPMNAMDKDTISKLAPAIGNVMSNPSTATQLNTLIKKAGGGA
jgi:hypothetical protein